MLKDHVQALSELVQYELRQCTLEGRDMAAFGDRIAALGGSGMSSEQKETLAAEILDGLANAPNLAGYPYVEPVHLQDIRDARPMFGGGLRYDRAGTTEEALYDRIYGAWLGRCAGCLLGQPVEFWPRERLMGLLRETGNYPIRYYISSNIPIELREKYGVSDQGWSYGCSVTNWINNISHMPEDDDINYVILALKTLEESGAGFTNDSVGVRWLMDLPALHTFTAERIAYKNLLIGVFPPASASYRNPCREWIGAQIRGDFFGYINPGRPEDAAEMAYRDGSVSHTKNGVYAEMFVAAMLSAAAAGAGAKGIIQCGLSQIPVNCRLTEAVTEVLRWREEGVSPERAVEQVHERYDETMEFDSLYVIPNAMIVCIALIYGELDFEKSIGIAVEGSFDKDCNGATVGSVVGMALGASALPVKGTESLHDTVKSGVDGFGVVSISRLAERTVTVLKNLRISREETKGNA
jgi:ADP-ribosylglycohydrolase